jgi:signal transduction histidine kinase
VNESRRRLLERVSAALRDYLGGGGEAALHAGYETGREALELGLGVLEVSAMTHEALLDLAMHEEAARVVRALAGAGPFALECLSPFEMAHRGARESNVALRRIVQAREDENRRLALELHDQASQMVAVVHLALDRVTGHLAPEGRAHLESVRQHLRTLEQQLRRITHEMRPAMLDDLGLMAALRFLGEGVGQRSGLMVRVTGSLDERPPAAVEIALYRVAQEALNNVVRHAQASRVTLHIERREECAMLTVRDDGAGFDPGAAVGNATHQGLGLRGVRERVAALGGVLRIHSAPGRGTEVCVVVPFVGVTDGAHTAGR